MKNTKGLARRPPRIPKGMPDGTWAVRREPYLVRKSGNDGRVVALHPDTGVVPGKTRVNQFVTPEGWIVLVPE